MKTERTKLLDALDVVKPAIAAKGIVEALTHVWFKKGELLAYDDVLGLRAPFDSGDVKGGLRGNVLVGLLMASAAQNVEISANGKEAELKAAKARLKMPLLDEEFAIWEFPAIKKAATYLLTQELLDALGDVLIAVGQDMSTPDQLGITFAMEEDGLVLFATDAKTIAQSYVKAPKGYEVEHAVLPTPFIEQVLRLCKPGDSFAILDDAVVAQCENGVGIYARLVDVPEPHDFNEALGRALPKGFVKKSVPIPGVLENAVDRALVVLDGKIAEPINMFVKDNTLHLESESALGELKDEIPLEGDHQKASIRVDPMLIKRALEKCDSMLIGERCLAMVGRDGDFVYVVSGVEK